MTCSESSLRRRVSEAGYRLQKSRSRNPAAAGYGGYVIVDPTKRMAVAGVTPVAYSYSLEDVADWLEGKINF